MMTVESRSRTESTNEAIRETEFEDSTATAFPRMRRMLMIKLTVGEEGEEEGRGGGRKVSGKSYAS